MAHKFQIGEEVWFRWGVVMKGKITAYTEELINDESISAHYKIKSLGVSEELRFRPVCEKCARSSLIDILMTS